LDNPGKIVKLLDTKYGKIAQINGCDRPMMSLRGGANAIRLGDCACPLSWILV
jgi:hypothetical protein